VAPRRPTRIPAVPAGLEHAAGWAWRLLICVAAAAAVVILLWYLRVIVLPAIVAVTIAPALTPLADRLRRAGVGRGAPALALVLGLVVVAALIAVVTASVVREYDELVVSVRAGLDDLTDWLEGDPLNVSLDRDLDGTLRSAWRETSTYLVSGARSSVSVLTGIVLVVALLYFILRDGALLWRRVVERFPEDLAGRVDRAGLHAWRVLGGYVRGTAAIAAIDATLIGIGLWILGVPLAFALAVIIFLGAFIPFVGATISGMFAVLVALADGGPGIALIALGIVLGVQFLEGNFLQPIIQSRTVDLHPAVILLAVAAGGSLFGILGAYLAVPMTAVAFAVASAVRAEEAVPEAPLPPPAGPEALPEAPLP
jgi:predicted PurR-regulated permease PerM